MALMPEASDWLLSRGIRQWRRMYAEEGRAFVAARFATDDVYLVYLDGVPVATFTIRWQETTLWGDAGSDGQAGYLHGFVVSRKVGGQGVGTALMAWIEKRIAARGRRYLRLNTAAGNQGICGYYEREGFLPYGVVPHFIGGMTQLLEREISIPDEQNVATL
jgi:ribosomal protein S18 acetylase RimI-like enzyme